LSELGAERFYKRGDADDAVGLEQVVEPWIEGLWKKLEKLFQQEKQESIKPPLESTGKFLRVDLLKEKPQEQPTEKKIPTTGYNVQNPYMAKIVNVQTLTAEGAQKKVIHMALSIKDSGIKYHPGDAVGVICENDPKIVDTLLERLGLSEQADMYFALSITDPSRVSLLPDHIKFPCTVREAFLKYCDISAVVTPTMLNTLAHYCTEKIHKSELLSMGSSLEAGRKLYRVRIRNQRANILDILRWYPSCKPPLDHLLQILPAIQPRYYSISCSPLLYPDEIQFAFTVVKYTTAPPGYIDRVGLCTSWLEKMSNKYELVSKKGGSVEIPIFLRHGAEFKLPSDCSTHMIMIGYYNMYRIDIYCNVGQVQEWHLFVHSYSIMNA
jgi:sulfite reductase alpha subunit-like flavoprotein